eukprot:1287561-Amphidinium_carterae.1
MGPCVGTIKALPSGVDRKGGWRMFGGQVGGHSLLVDVVDDRQGGGLTFEVSAQDFGSGELLLHYGVGKQALQDWGVPTDAIVKSTPAAIHVPGAWQTPFPPQDPQGCRKIVLEFKPNSGLKGFQFVLHKKPNEWLKCGNKNFVIDFEKVERSRSFREILQKAEAQTPPPKVTCWSCPGAEVAIVAVAGPQACLVHAVVSSQLDLVLQYGMAGYDNRWTSSTRLNLTRTSQNISEGSITVPFKTSEKLLMFVLHDASHNQWLKDGGRDFAFELPEPGSANVSAAKEESPPASPKLPPPPEKKAAWKEEPDAFASYIQQAKEEDPNAVVAKWTLRDAEVVMIATATDQECNVHALVVSPADLVLQYGLAGEDR